MGKIDSKVILPHTKYIKNDIKCHLDNLPKDKRPKMPKCFSKIGMNANGTQFLYSLEQIFLKKTCLTHASLLTKFTSAI
jgi:hypothetical protein